ncbi:hypothetical protein SAMN05920897_1209 [Alkalispirochaeta americana]|uniref:Uncharacterized protein n=1 Tax=Alkalispirochaeta americana TaxID=159291 RepID=A0A1N6X364_9SPIO|nr:hypothetical protein SAMN05920897_1209 [Alkalispirochaeta americana]
MVVLVLATLAVVVLVLATLAVVVLVLATLAVLVLAVLALAVLAVVVLVLATLAVLVLAVVAPALTLAPAPATLTDSDDPGSPGGDPPEAAREAGELLFHPPQAVRQDQESPYLPAKKQPGEAAAGAKQKIQKEAPHRTRRSRARHRLVWHRRAQERHLPGEHPEPVPVNRAAPGAHRNHSPTMGDQQDPGTHPEGPGREDPPGRARRSDTPQETPGPTLPAEES